MSEPTYSAEFLAFVERISIQESPDELHELRPQELADLYVLTDALVRTASAALTKVGDVLAPRLKDNP